MKMASTRCLNFSAQLRNLTTLRSVREYDTRWSLILDMIERFFQIQTKPIVPAYLIPFLIPSLV